MSINLENPETVLGKVDAAANYVAQIRIATMVGDKPTVLKCVEQADRLLFAAQTQIEDQEEKEGHPAMYNEMAAYLAPMMITSENIGAIRARLLMPFTCDWNGWVRDLTAEREVKCSS